MFSIIGPGVKLSLIFTCETCIKYTFSICMHRCNLRGGRAEGERTDAKSRPSNSNCIESIYYLSNFISMPGVLGSKNFVHKCVALVIIEPLIWNINVWNWSGGRVNFQVIWCSWTMFSGFENLRLILLELCCWSSGFGQFCWFHPFISWLTKHQRIFKLSKRWACLISLMLISTINYFPSSFLPHSNV